MDAAAPHADLPAGRAAHAGGRPGLQINLESRDGRAQQRAARDWAWALAQRWLVDVHLALPSIIAVDTWKGTGYIMVILLAGLQSIPEEYYEAAAIDGANAWARLRHITLPLLMPAITVTTVLNLLYAIKVFDIVYVLTNGGPGFATEVVFTAVFKEFSKGRYGVGTAISMLLFVIMVVLGYYVIRLMTRQEQADA